MAIFSSPRRDVGRQAGLRELLPVLTAARLIRARGIRPGGASGGLSVLHGRSVAAGIPSVFNNEEARLS